MKKYIIAREKSGAIKVIDTLDQLLKEIDNISSWLKVRAESPKEAIEKFPEIEKKYEAIYDLTKINHIISINQLINF